MPTLKLHAPQSFEQGFAAIRSEQDVPSTFPQEVIEAAVAATDAYAGSRRDVRDLPFVAVDPPGAMDLDQAFHAERIPDDGYRVHYAIADVAAFVPAGGPVDREARRRGTTLYSPDIRTALHPPVISEDRASLLAGTTKPCLLWTIDLDPSGAPINATVARATVRVKEAISYAEAQKRIDEGSDDVLALLKEVGLLRQQQEADRGGISLNLPAQEVVEQNGSFALEYDQPIPVEGWNAQISLLTGIVAGRMMRDAGIGVLRTLPPPRKQDLRRLRHQAQALGVDWPDEVEYPDLVRSITPDSPTNMAFLLKAARSFRGAGYVGFQGELPELSQHGAIASHYAHVTAPLRRLVDRFGNEIVLALSAGTDIPSWALEALDELPSLMGKAKSRESALEKAMVDFAEACVLSGHIGQEFHAFVVDVDPKRDRAVLQLRDPAVVANIEPNGRTLAEEIVVTLAAVDTKKRTVTFIPASP